MNKFIRKIIHMEILNKDYCISGKSFVAYYKMENRNDICRITLSVDGIKMPYNEEYILFIIYGKDTYFMHQVKKLSFDKGNRIYDTISIDEEKFNDLKGVSILSKKNSTNQVNYEKDTIIVGFKGEKISLDQLSLDKIIEEKVKKDKGLEAYLGEKSKDINIYVDKEINETNKKVNEEISKEINEEINGRINKEKNNGINREHNRTEDKSKEKDNNSNDEQNKKKREENLNTLEFIKKRLEQKDELNLFNEIFDKKPKMSPFENEDPKMDWVRIEMTDLIFLPLESWMLMNNAFLMNNYRKYKHLILGRNKEKGILKLGIPDIYYFKESIVANICGFNEFATCNDTPPKSGDYGYWIIKTQI